MIGRGVWSSRRRQAPPAYPISLLQGSFCGICIVSFGPAVKTFDLSVRQMVFFLKTNHGVGEDMSEPPKILRSAIVRFGYYGGACSWVAWQNDVFSRTPLREKCIIHIQNDARFN